MSIPVIRNAFFISLLIITVSAVPGLLSFQPTSAQTLDGVYTDGFRSVKKSEQNSFLKSELRFKILDDSNNVKRKKKFVMTKSPWTAVALSAVLPGLGQFYNKSYWKIPVIVVIGGYFSYEIIRNNNLFLEYRDKYAQSQTTGSTSGDPVLKTFREFYRDQRDLFIIYFGILYLVNLFDAYVDAHLYDFDVSDEIKVGVLRNGKLLKFDYYF
jgi:hypothetical protein